MIKNSNLRNFSFLMLLAIGYRLLAVPVHAQITPEFLVSWQAQNYIPTWYQGKIFPTNGTRINVRFDLVDNGKIADLLSSTCEREIKNNVCVPINDGQSHPCRVRWYVNDDLKMNENDAYGIKTFSFSNDSVYDGNNIELHISIPNYKCQPLDKIVSIPVKSPELTIETPYYEQRVGKENKFIVWPFFFNSITGMSFKWLMDGAEVGSNSPFLNLSIDPATLPTTKINLELQVQNANLETANKSIELEAK